MPKPVPTHTPGPVSDDNPAEHQNLSPQGKLHIDDPGAHYTPEGDNEGHPAIPEDENTD